MAMGKEPRGRKEGAGREREEKPEEKKKEHFVCLMQQDRVK
jgi:hypothetical protein